jgi:Zn-dependent protease
MIDSLIQFGYLVIALLVVLSVHEAAHALVAYWLGDPTAKMRGRLTLNPMAHLDMMGSLLFLLTQRIGWGKPVPVNPANFKRPVRDSALTALAGPMSNFILSFLVAMFLKYVGVPMSSVVGNEVWQYVDLIFWMIFHVSIYLGIFNLFPFPPLDGSKILGLIVPKRFYPQYDRFLENGVKYFVAIILIDVFILGDLLGTSVFASVMLFLHDIFAAVLLLGT